MIPNKREVIRFHISKNRQHNGQKIPKGDNQIPYIEEQTTQWPKEKLQKKTKNYKTYT